MRHLKVEPILRCIKCKQNPDIEINSINEALEGPNGEVMATQTYYFAGLKCPCGQKASGVDITREYAFSEACIDWTILNLP